MGVVLFLKGLKQVDDLHKKFTEVGHCSQQDMLLMDRTHAEILEESRVNHEKDQLRTQASLLKRRWKNSWLPYKHNNYGRSP